MSLLKKKKKKIEKFYILFQYYILETQYAFYT